MKTAIQIILLLVAINLNAQISALKDFSIAKKDTIYSDILNEKREIFIHTPKGFGEMDDSLNCYSLTIVLDGESQFQHTVSAIDFLSSAPLGNDKIPRTIVVGIPNTSRMRDLTPIKGMLGTDTSSLRMTGGGRKFLEFITSELIPNLESRFALSHDRTIIGHSLGGLIVFEALLNKNEYFNNYLAIDPGFHFDNESFLSDVLEAIPSAKLREENLFVATANTISNFIGMENIPNDTSEIAKMTKSNLRFLRNADAESWNISFTHKDFPNEDHFSIPYLATFEGMKNFYSYYPFKEMIHYYHPSYVDRTDLLAKLKEHYENVSDLLGCKVIPMESYINSWAFGLSQFGRTDLSIDLFGYNLELYPNKSSVYNTLGYFMMNHGNQKEAIQLFEKSIQIQKNKGIKEVLEKLQGSEK